MRSQALPAPWRMQAQRSQALPAPVLAGPPGTLRVVEALRQKRKSATLPRLHLLEAISLEMTLVAGRTEAGHELL